MSTYTHMDCMVRRGIKYASESFGVGLGWGGVGVKTFMST